MSIRARWLNAPIVPNVAFLDELRQIKEYSTCIPACPMSDDELRPLQNSHEDPE